MIWAGGGICFLNSEKMPRCPATMDPVVAELDMDYSIQSMELVHYGN